MCIHNEQELPPIPETSIADLYPAPDFASEYVNPARSYLRLTMGIATVAVASGLYDWREKWEAAKKAVDKAEEERDSIPRDTEEGKDKWWAADQRLQGKITDMYEVEDGPHN